MAAMDCETALSAELSLAMRNETLDLDDLPSGTSSASSDISSLSACLDLDTTALPRLDDFSSVEEALSSPLDALPPLPVSLSHSLSPRIPEPAGTPSNSSISACNSPQPSSQPPLSPPCCPAAAAVPELSARLRAACCETSALRARVAELTRENRSLRASLAEASSKPPLLVGLAHVSADVAGAISTALSLGTANVTGSNSDPPPPPSKKRKRAAAGKTLACLVLLAGFFFGSPGMLRDGDSTHSTDALPTPWRSRNSGSGSQRSSAVAEVRVRTPPVRASNCIRPLEALPPGTPAIVKEELVMEDTEKKIHVNGAGARVVEMHDAQKEKFSYVLCRDSRAAVQNAKECGKRIQGGEQCSRENSITLIMPAAAVGLERDDGGEEYAEVHCNIVRVARIPPAAATKKNAPHFGGRVVATVPDRMQ